MVKTTGAKTQMKASWSTEQPIAVGPWRLAQPFNWPIEQPWEFSWSCGERWEKTNETRSVKYFPPLNVLNRQQIRMRVKHRQSLVHSIGMGRTYFYILFMEGVGELLENVNLCESVIGLPVLIWLRKDINSLLFPYFPKIAHILSCTEGIR